MKIKLFNVAFFITALLAILANVYEEKLCLLWLQVLVIPNVNETLVCKYSSKNCA